MEVEPKSCWFCRRPVLVGERANRVPQGWIAVHTDCLRADAFNDGSRPNLEDRVGDTDPRRRSQP